MSVHLDATGAVGRRAPLDRRSTIMWNGTVRALPFAEQVAATARAGFGQLSVTPQDCARWFASGLSARDMIALCADHDVVLTHLDPLACWTTRWEPTNLGPSGSASFAFDVDDFLRTAEALEIASFTAIAVSPPGAVTMDEFTESFAHLCDRANDAGLVCELEFIPLGWGIPDLSTAWRIVEAADRANSGIVLDFWHFLRSGSTFEQLRAVPGERITSVQLCDAHEVLPAGRDPAEDCLLHRRPLGDGEFPVARLLATLADIGGLNRVGPEYFSHALDAMGAPEVADLCRHTVVAALDAASVPHTLSEPRPPRGGAGSAPAPTPTPE